MTLQQRKSMPELPQKRVLQNQEPDGTQAWLRVKKDWGNKGRDWNKRRDGITIGARPA
jgi:hypothetical protein